MHFFILMVVAILTACQPMTPQEKKRWEKNMAEWNAEQAKIEKRKRLAESCIQSYEASMPKEYDTQCDGGATPDGGVVHGYSNCKTTESRRYAPAYITRQCYDEAEKAVSFKK